MKGVRGAGEGPHLGTAIRPALILVAFWVLSACVRRRNDGGGEERRKRRRTD